MSSVELRAGVVRVFISLLFFVFPCVCVEEQSGVGSRVRLGLGGFVAASLGAKTVCLADCGKNTLENVSRRWRDGMRW